ncbi:MAG: protein kinase, partial [Planctomycetota bacterium]|nr:protein kinase [Planctomycetota bacterium]
MSPARLCTICSYDAAGSPPRLSPTHADVRLANVRLRADGQAVLVDTGIRAIVEPEQTIHSGLPPDRFDGVAPELIGTQRSADFPSDLYSLGCLLWQLLAGRPPFPGGDPLLKLAAHQTRSIPDVRQFAPDTPERLAKLIFRLTRSQPNERPASVFAVVAEWNTVAPANPRLLQRFRREFDRPKRLADRANGPRTATRIAATAIVAAFLAGVFFWKPEWTEPIRGVLPTGSPVPEISESAGGAADGDLVVPAAHEEPVNDRHDEGSSPSVVPAAAVEVKSQPVRRYAKLPNPDGQGVILLEAGEQYRGRAINAVGPLIIRTKGETPAIVHLDAPLELVAETVRLERVTLEVASLAEGSRDDSLAACIDVRAQSISADGVTVWNRANSGSTTAGAASLRWELVDDRDTRPTSAVFTDCVFQGGSATLVVPQPVSVVQFTNCLHQRQECVLELAGSARRTREVVLRL